MRLAWLCYAFLSQQRLPYDTSLQAIATPRRVKDLFRRAQSLERKGQWRKAQHLLQEILELDEHDAHSHLALARLQARRHRPADANFQRGVTACPDSVHLWQAWAVYQERQGQYEKARTTFERALEIDSRNPYVCHAYGLMEERLGNLKRAGELWDRALESKSTAALVCQRGQLYITQGQHEEAQRLYAKHVDRVRNARERTEVYLSYAWLEERHFRNYAKAHDLLQEALELSPSSSLALVALARLEGRHRAGEGKATTRRLAKACEAIENGTAESIPEDGRIYNTWANLEAKARRYEKARKILDRGTKRYPRDYSLLQAAGKMEERVGNYTGARSFYASSLRVQPSAPTLVAYALLELRKPESGEVDHDRVQRLFEEALMLDPRHGPAYNSYGKILMQNGRIQSAREIFERGIQAGCSDMASVYHGYARLEISEGNIRTAKDLLARGIKESKRVDMSMDSPHRDRAAFLAHTLGMLELNSDRAVVAMKVFQDGLSRYGKSSQLLLGTALCEVKLGNEDNARYYFEQAVLSDEKHAQAWQAWGVMEMRAGNWTTAKTLFECGLRNSPRHGALWVSYAISEGRLGNTQTARELFAKGLRQAPNHAPLFQAWASLEQREHNYEAARTLITQALTRDKKNGHGWLIAANIEQRLGNEGLSTLILRRGIECSPNSPELYKALGDVLLGKMKINEAREVYESGIEVDQMYAPLYHSLAQLEAQIFNVEGLAKLNKRAARVFTADATSVSTRVDRDEAFGARIRAGRGNQLPERVAALADRIGDTDSSLKFDDADPDAFIDEMTSGIVNGVVGSLVTLEEPSD